MRFAAVAIAFFTATLVQAQLPACTNPCYAPGVLNLDGCIASNNACLCKSEVFVNSTRQCFVENCEGTELATAVELSVQMCLAVGVTLSGPLPTRTGSATGSAATGANATTGKPAASSPPATTNTSPAPSGSTTNNTSGASTTGASLALVGAMAAGVVALAL